MNFTDYLITKHAVAAKIQAYSWKEAISEGGKVLVGTGACTPEYISAIIETCEMNGPYFVISKGIAMPHARPEKGGLDDGAALVTLETPVVFEDPENDPIDILIFISGKTAASHVEDAMCQVADFCDDAENIETLRRMNTSDEILKFLKKIKGNKK